MSSPISICIIGAPGLIGLRHTAHALDEPLVQLSCIVDPTPAGPALAAQHALILFESVEAMLAARASAEVEVEGAILATPNSTHVPLGIQLIEAGIHTLVEKPVSTSVESGRALIAAAAKGNAKVLVGHHRRFNPYIVNAKKILDSGKLGKVLAIQGVWSCLKPSAYFEAPTAWRAQASAGGPILINLVHDIDLLRHLFGDIVRVYCEEGVRTRGHEVEETGAVTLRFASGAVGTFVFSDAVASPHSFEGATGENPMIPHSGAPVYTILGTEGTVSFPELKVYQFPAQPSTTTLVDSAHTDTQPAKKGDWTTKMEQLPAAPIDPTPPFTHQLRHFARVCSGEEEPGCSGLEALKSLMVLEAVKESIRTGLPVRVAQE